MLGTRGRQPTLNGQAGGGKAAKHFEEWGRGCPSVKMHGAAQMFPETFKEGGNRAFAPSLALHLPLGLPRQVRTRL